MLDKGYLSSFLRNIRQKMGCFHRKHTEEHEIKGNEDLGSSDI
ncbi:hypothetical protein [Candidatus Enterovibrio escicola]|nr:hypothetical protein [Candidatus Enterovibrio escacola]